MKSISSQPRNPIGVPAGSVKPIHFYCAAPDARTVELAGDFNHWRAFPMRRLMDGWWSAQVELSPGHHQYLFFVDGKPMLDPQACGIGLNGRNERVSLVAVS